MSLLRFLGLAPAAPDPAAAETESVRAIADALERLEPARARLVAAFAYTLGRVARADLEVSREETRAMERLVAERMGLPEAQAVLAVQIARTHSKLFGATEDFLVTRELEGLATREQKLAVLDCLFAVSAADEDVSVAEDNEIRRIANELKLSHQDFIAARSRYREHLAVLKRPGDGP